MNAYMRLYLPVLKPFREQKKTYENCSSNQKDEGIMKLSIIVPVYNLENYIATTLDSLLSICFSDEYEIIVINDGSIDKSESIIRDYQQKYCQITLCSIEHQGVSNARNVAISKASGEYITFVDGDDTVEPDFFERAVQELDGGGYDFVQGNYRRIDGDNTSYDQFVSEDVVITEKDIMHEKLFGLEKLIHNHVWGKVFRAEIIKDTIFDRTIKIGEDLKFVFDVIEKSKKIKLLSCVGYNYIQRNTSAMHVADINRYIDDLNVFSYCRNNISNKNILLYIERRELLTLLAMYNVIARNGGDNRECYEKICALDIKPIRDILSRRERIKIFLFKHARFIYDLIIRKRHKNSNG